MMMMMRRWRVRRLPNHTIPASSVYMYEIPINFHSFVPYYFSYFSNSCTSFHRGVTVHSCHLEQGSWYVTFLEGDHYRLGQRYRQRKGEGKEKTTLSFTDGQFLFSEYR
jgi:hypothetical protein